ncbi:MAG: PQQ-dependent sugar dehydrogenase [Promethearchaeota archaeon]
MKKKPVIIALVVFTFLLGISQISTSVMAPFAAAQSENFTVEEAFPNLTFESPVGIYNAGDGSDRLFVLEQQGIIYVFENNKTVSSKKIFLNISEQVLSGGEQGLLGLAFHPDYENNGYFYVDYTAADPRRTVIARYKVDAVDLDKADKNSEFIIMEVAQPYSNHNGGQISFGPDGYLYIALGDGGSGGDPDGNGQNLQTLLGSILRINVTKSNGLNYTIPDDNPFVGNTQGYKEEIYAYGLRNPWRFSFDNETGWLWAGDVGQSSWEEIDIIEKGKNYGWNIMEGNHCYSPSSGCDTAGLELPIWEYSHNVGHSITGGFVYRGTKFPELSGSYIYGDFENGQIWALQYNGTSDPVNTLLCDTNLLITSFGVDENNEQYLSAINGKIYTLVYGICDFPDNGNGNDGSSGGGGDDGSSDGGGSSKKSVSLDFLENYYSIKPGENVTLSGTISSDANGQLITITFEGETYKTYTFNNGTFEVTVTAANIYGSYTATAKFSGDSTWKSASTTCQVLVIEEETQMTLNVNGNLENGEQITITVTVTKENGAPVAGEQVLIYIYEQEASSTTSSLQSDVKSYATDARYWNLIKTLEVTTDDNGNAVTEWAVSTDKNIQIVAEYTGNVEGEGGVNIGSSTASYVEGEMQTQSVFGFIESLYLFGAIGVGVAVTVIGVITMLKRKKAI